MGGTIRGICTSCEDETEFERVKREEDLKVRGENVTVEVEYSRCKRCGEEVIDPNVSPDPFYAAYRKYREKHGMLQPEDIRRWRKEHGLSQAELSKLLGIGIATINRYENGALQTDSHEKLLKMAMEPSTLLKLVESSKDVFNERKKKHLMDGLKQIGEEAFSLDNTIEIKAGDSEPGEFNGYKRIDLQKLYNAMLFFSREGILKSKLLKLLFYADFKHFKESTISVTGARYAHASYGPVPHNFLMYFASLADHGMADFEEEFYPNGYAGEIVKARKEPDLNVFSPGELRILATVAEDFKSYTATQLRDFSHEERGYKETSDGELISYKYAESLCY